MESMDNIVSIFIGGLALEISEKDVFDYLSPLCRVVEVSLPVSKDTSKKMGFAFVKLLGSTETITNILSSAHNIRGRWVEFQMTVDPEDKDNYLKDLRARKIFLSNLPKDIEPSDIVKRLNRFGEVRNCYKLQSHNKKTDLAYAEMHDPEVCTLLIQHGLDIDGALVKISAYRPRRQTSDELAKDSSRVSQRYQNQANRQSQLMKSSISSQAGQSRSGVQPSIVYYSNSHDYKGSPTKHHIGKTHNYSDAGGRKVIKDINRNNARPPKVKLMRSTRAILATPKLNTHPSNYRFNRSSVPAQYAIELRLEINTFHVATYSRGD